ncbi:uncharacterized protein MYCFIDRAFT_210981 [Pseudocercospora fijiensis CIRAD86]|uniref:Uncharacterized protein n=1 Tax=Pseudocercospora fijiensis (strain CIRAD86) TaxID=383855 RepID=M3A0Y8_PSEFD|nr:uncharacterized protein MYCFIDRAFT_210981 [Pseudocercospora fijiensis CIRAD86]EME84804.1 hypothetical protein MYCFIDRAFT_210981 [Pseudocercospora fijiensis CIRAD86]
MDDSPKTPTSYHDLAYNNAYATDSASQVDLALTRIRTVIDRLEGRLEQITDQVADAERRYTHLEDLYGDAEAAFLYHDTPKSVICQDISEDLKKAMFEVTVARALAGVAKKMVSGPDGDGLGCESCGSACSGCSCSRRDRAMDIRTRNSSASSRYSSE